MAKFRKERVRERLLSVVATALRSCRDPRLEFVTITDVEVSGDLRHACIYWSLLSSQVLKPLPSLVTEGVVVGDVDAVEGSIAQAVITDKAAAVELRSTGHVVPEKLFPEKSEVLASKKALESAKSVFRSIVAEELNLRIVPELRFQYDDSASYGAKIDILLNKIKEPASS